MRSDSSEKMTGTFWTGLPRSSKTLAVIAAWRELVIRCGSAVTRTSAGRALPMSIVMLALPVPLPVGSAATSPMAEAATCADAETGAAEAGEGAVGAGTGAGPPE